MAVTIPALKSSEALVARTKRKVETQRKRLAKAEHEHAAEVTRHGLLIEQYRSEQSA